MTKNRKLIGILILAAVIILPTGIDDAFTTIPLIAWLGFDAYLKIALGILAIMLIAEVNFNDVKKEVGKLW